MCYFHEIQIRIEMLNASILFFFLGGCSLSYDVMNWKFMANIIPLLSFAVSYYSLFPLLYEGQEYPIKVLLLLLHTALIWLGFSSHFCTTSASEHRGNEKLLSTSASKNVHSFVIGWFGKLYLVGLMIIEIWGQFLHPIFLGNKFPFLPLMITSIYCGFGMIHSWIWQLRFIIKSLW